MAEAHAAKHGGEHDDTGHGDDTAGALLR